MKEPKRDNKIEHLEPETAKRFRALFAAMQAKGYDPVLFEGLRSQERQNWLYGIGRTHQLRRRPVTWTLRSYHRTGKAGDVISKSGGWNWPEFYAALHSEAHKVGLTPIPQEACHLQVS